jgi:Ca2+-binding EF-hand superfamily protein
VADLEKLWLQNGEITNRLKENNNGVPSKQNEALDKSKLLNEKLVIDKVLTDQLSNFSLNNEDELNTHRSNVNLKTIYTSRGNRIISNDNHLRPASSLSENVLSKRCKFNCRIKSPNGKLALRDLFGILFLHDGSMTIYELHTNSAFAKKANALPFLNRKVYTHAFGRRRGQQIDIWDVFNGAVIYLQNNTNEKSSKVPSSLREPEFLEIELYGVDEQEKENLLISDELQKPKNSQLDMNENIEFIRRKVRQPHNEIDSNDLKIINSVRKFMCKQIEKRSVEVYLGLSSYLKDVANRNGNSKTGLITEQDFHNALFEYNIQMHSEDLDIVWQVLDCDGCGYLSYYSLMRAYFGEMNSNRHSVFRTLVNKLDTQKIGYIQINAIKKFFKAALHPKVKSGDLTEDEMFNKFLRLFELLEPTKLENLNEISAYMDIKTKLISYEQFEEYYNGLSIEVENDADFIQILKNSWNLV